MLELSHFNRTTIKGDFFGAITSTIVALPFALAFGITSGLGASAGIYCAILTGFFASLFGGTNQQISGPNTGLTVAMAAILTSLVSQDPENGVFLAFTVVVLAGFFQILFGLLKLGKYFVLVSYPVISGFTSGIGVLIILSQIEPIFGYSLAEVFTHTDALVSSNSLLVLACLILLFYWPEKYSRIIPASVVALVGGTVFFVFFASDLSVVGAIENTLPSLKMPSWNPELTGEMIKSALLIATLSTLDSLMTSLTVDSLSDDLHDSDKELIGQGIGNIAAGLFGALPGGGATMRTMTNLRAGGKTPLSGMLHAIFILMIVLWAGDYTAYIPSAVLAAILVKVGLSIIDWNFLKRIHQVPTFSAVLMLLTLVMSVALNLVTAVLIGVFLANLVTIRRLSEIQLDNLILYSGEKDERLSITERELIAPIVEQLLLLKISGPISFGVARSLKLSISQEEPRDNLLIDFEQAKFVGITSTIALEEVIVSFQSEGRNVYLANVSAGVEKSFNKLKLLSRIPQEHIFANSVEALKYINEKN